MPTRDPITGPLRPRGVRDRAIAELTDALTGSVVHGDAETVVRGITHDSRQVQPGDLYVARAGANVHGVLHVADAVRAGAAAVLTDPVSVQRALDAGARAVVEVPDPRSAAGTAAAWVYGQPAQAITVVGITGTNGKTTTAYLVEAGLRAAGHRTGLIGTIETHIAGAVVKSIRTTPESTDLQALFAMMRERGVDTAVMEVSSHALALDRVTGTTFGIAAFTNLSQDHLDFHRDMDDYFAAKAKLFSPELSRRGVVVSVDEWGRRMAAAASIPVVTVGGEGSDWSIVDEQPSAVGGAVRMVAPDGVVHDVRVALPGRFNLTNAALAYVVLLELGVAADEARAGLASLASVPGRMERIDAGQDFVALVDYAHTPEAVAELLTESRLLAGPGGRVVVVLGCGGDRDRGKRPMMGAAAAAGADLAIFTNDNPRSEDPVAILDAMVEGARAQSGSEVIVEPDRRAAIALAVRSCSRGDVLVVAGKGHEQGQETAGVVVPFDDRDALRAALVDRGHRVGAG